MSITVTWVGMTMGGHLRNNFPCTRSDPALKRVGGEGEGGLGRRGYLKQVQCKHSECHMKSAVV